MSARKPRIPPSEDARRCRRLWERISEDGLFWVVAVTQTPLWTLCVRVPWCRFARTVVTDRDYEELVAKLENWRSEDDDD